MLCAAVAAADCLFEELLVDVLLHKEEDVEVKVVHVPEVHDVQS